MEHPWKIFFRVLEDQSITAEELYQAFKARLTSELNLKLKTKCPDCDSHAIFWEEDYSRYRCYDCGWISND